jgi:hypothetical protein
MIDEVCYMRFDNYLIEDTKEFDNTLKLLTRYDLDKIKNILSTSWIKLRESLSTADQNILVSIINEHFGTNYKNVYSVTDKIETIPNDWKDHLCKVSQAWLELNESSSNNVLLTYGLIWVKLVSGGVI